jgi:hypothetical protein
MPHTTFLVAGAAILSFGAVYLVGRPEEWPDGVPSRSYYEGVWQSDARHRALQPRAQYLARVLKFYSGSAGRPGWNRRQSEILELLGPEEARFAEPQLVLLGQQISSEWSKPDPLRRIPSRTLALWGDALRKARDADRLAPVLDRIREDVGSVLRGELPSSALTPARYEARVLTMEAPR